MVDSRAFNSEARKPGVSEHTRYVHGVISNRLFPREETVYCVQCCLPGRCYSHLL